MKRTICIVLTLILCFSISAPAFAARQSDTITESIVLSDTTRMEMTKHRNISTVSTTARPSDPQAFEVTLYENNEIVRKINGAYGQDELVVEHNQNGEIISTETLLVSSRITRIESTSIVPENLSVARASKLLGYMTCAYSEPLDEKVQFRVHGELVRTNDEAYQLKTKAGDTVDVVATVISVLLGDWLSIKAAASLAMQIAAAAGILVVDNIIKGALVETLAVEANYYSLWAYNLTLKDYCDGVEGVSRRVTTKGKYYDEVFYEGYTFDNWKEEGLAYYFWYQFYDYSFPGLA